MVVVKEVWGRRGTESKCVRERVMKVFAEENAPYSRGRWVGGKIDFKDFYLKCFCFLPMFILVLERKKPSG